ncbi:MAG TPA: metallophosphoesterase [Povalibacter sp.]|nr:metallophosphoesterase [Povalibacter sp.]
MSIPNTDLLPPLFDQVLTHYGQVAPGPYTRADIIKALENSIINAAADRERAEARLAGHVRPRTDHFELRTFDRLSGDHISRAALTEKLQAILSLNRLVIEIALLLVEAQIDLRLRAGASFKLAGIAFARAPEATPLDPEFHESAANHDIAAWCRNVLPLTLQGATKDVPTVWNRIGRYRPEGVRVFVESLQLSATLREAVPYLIRVDSRLVEPLLVEERPDGRIRLLHISDLHLVEDLIDPKRGGSPTLWQTKHDFEAARLLGRAVDSLEPAFDVLVATGDLTTDGTQGSFETVRQYIQSGPISGENKMRIATFGMNAGRGQRILLPGNHDRFDGKLLPGQRLSHSFEEILGTKDEYPYVVGFRPPNQPSTALTLLFFVFDSNLPNGPEGSSLQARFNALAEGSISREETYRLDQLAREAAQNCEVPDLQGERMEFSPDNTVRIALLHHHPVAELKAEQAERRRNDASRFRWFTSPIASVKDRSLALSERAMKLKGADDFLRQCFSSGIQLILFGHQHFPYRRVIALDEKDGPFGKARYMRAFCCPTTLERSEHGNGFYVFDFPDNKSFTMDFHVSAVDGNRTSGPFSRIAEKSGRYDLTELLPQESELLYEMKG